MKDDTAAGITPELVEQGVLIPEKHMNHDLFLCDVADATLKDLLPQLEHPFYSLSKKPDKTVRRYENGENWLEIVPAHKGAATIYDKDILIFAISQIVAKLNRGEMPTKRVRINSADLLRFTNRGVSGRDYMALQDSLDRLDGTRIRTNIVTGDEVQWESFGLIDASATRRKNGIDGRLLWCEVVLSDWVFNAITNKEVLTLHRDYFRLRRPIERRIYEIARKHCGQQHEWTISLEKLHQKTGSQARLRNLRVVIRDLANKNHLPDYIVSFDSELDQVKFTLRDEWFNEKPDVGAFPTFRDKDKTREKAAAFVLGDESVDDLVMDWGIYWLESGKPTIISPDAAFLGWCKNRFVRYKNNMD